MRISPHLRIGGESLSHQAKRGVRPIRKRPCQRCDGDGYLDIVDPDTGGVLGPRPCPDCGGSGERGA